MQPPPSMMMDRSKVIVGGFIVLGLLLLAAGAIATDLGRRQLFNATQEQVIDQTNLRVAWGPAIAHFGMFLLVVGLLGAVLFLQELDVFARLFLLLLAFVALLLVLANSSTIFGPP